MARAPKELNEARLYDYQLLNDDLNRAHAELKELLISKVLVQIELG
jgi:guanylate kinase